MGPPFQYCDTPELIQWPEQHTYTTLLAKSSNKRYYRGTNIGETGGRYGYIISSVFPSTCPQRGERESLTYISNSSPHHIHRRNLIFCLPGIFLHIIHSKVWCHVKADAAAKEPSWKDVSNVALSGMRGSLSLYLIIQYGTVYEL